MMPGNMMIRNFGQNVHFYSRSNYHVRRYHMPWNTIKVLGKFRLKLIPPARVNLQNFNISCILNIKYNMYMHKFITYSIQRAAVRFIKFVTQRIFKYQFCAEPSINAVKCLIIHEMFRKVSA